MESINPFQILDNRLDQIQSMIKSLEQKNFAIPTNEPSRDRYIDTKEVSELLGVSSVSVWQYEKQGILKSYRIGNLKRFRLSEVMSSPKAIERSKIKN